VKRNLTEGIIIMDGGEQNKKTAKNPHGASPLSLSLSLA
jgi:hypothetical protein